MSGLSLFFAQNVACDTTEEFVVSQRFKDKEGNAVAWKLRSMNEDENQECRKAATRKVKGKNGVYSSEIEPNDYMAKLMTSSVVHPDLKNAELEIEYIPFPEDLRGKYQNTTKANLTALESTGYTGTFTRLEDAMTEYYLYLNSNDGLLKKVSTV